MSELVVEGIGRVEHSKLKSGSGLYLPKAQTTTIYLAMFGTYPCLNVTFLGYLLVKCVMS